MQDASLQSTTPTWRRSQALLMATVCLVLGLALGYLFRGSERQSNSAPPQPDAQTANSGQQQMPSLEKMKQMAEKQAEPLLAKLKADPNNADLLLQIGNIYKATHQFSEAVGYYQRSIAAIPKNAAARTELASCLYYNGDVEGALAQLQQALSDSPNNVNSLFNLGVIRWQGKKDVAGAIAAWQQLLQSNPQLEAARRSQVEHLIAEVKKGMSQ